jgi:hypothetical protein
MKNKYYDGVKHKYMQHRSHAFADFVYSLIDDSSFSSYKTAVELGAGMGRFSSSIIANFADVTLVEPVHPHTEYLNSLFSNQSVRIVNTEAEEFLSNYQTDTPLVVFCFHLMHHLKPKQRDAIYLFVKRTGSTFVFVEPNPFNPLFLLQILLHPDMSFGEEIQYLKLTPNRYRREIEANGLRLTSTRNICFFPPIVTDFFLMFLPNSVVATFEQLNQIFPFLSSYQLITCEAPR